jgi:hypothetical protein
VEQIEAAPVGDMKKCRIVLQQILGRGDVEAANRGDDTAL